MSQEAAFVEHRSLLFTIAYEILGSATDAEDVLQDSYLRWSTVDPATVEHPRAYLVQVVTQQALDHLRTAQKRREQYVGTWLPEPLRTEPDAAEDVVLAESVSFAMMLVLETLSPDERAVFVLREVFGYSHREIADMVDKSEPTVRQISHRAREHVQVRRKRYQSDSGTRSEVVTSFLRAANHGDVAGLMDLMAPDVVQISDGGGKATAARRPVVGRDRVAQFVATVATKSMPHARAVLSQHNAQPSVLFYDGDRLDMVLLLEIVDDLVTGVYAVLNPDKLTIADRSMILTGRDQ